MLLRLWGVHGSQLLMVTRVRDIGALARALFASAVVIGALLALLAPTARAADPVIAAAGDIACDPADPYYYNGLGDATHCRQRYMSNLLVNAGLSAVLPLGDLQYDSASLAELPGLVRPELGPGEVDHAPGARQPRDAGNATGYFDYFNGSGVDTGPAGDRAARATTATTSAPGT